VPVRRATAAVLTGVLLLAGCGDDDPTTATGDPTTEPSGALPFGLVRCDPDAPRPAADEGLYRDEPVYVGNEQPTDEVGAWAREQPGFVELWIDRERLGWITLAFSEGADERQAELAERFPDVGVVAVGVDWSVAELEELAAEVLAVDGVEGANADTTHGVVQAFVPVLDEESLRPLADLAGPRLCVDGTDPADAVADGPQPTEGDGWRLLADELTGEAYRTGIASTEEQYAALWEESGVTADRPEVDLETEVVIWFGAVYGSSCPIRMDDVIVDEEASLVHGDFVIPGNPQACTDDANPRAFVVALDRERLPVGGFRLQLDADDPPEGAPEERTVVTADLSAPGSIAMPDEIGADANLLDPDGGYRVEPDGILEPGFPAALRVDPACDLTVIGPFNGVAFAADEPVVPTPDEWVAAAGDGGLDLDLLLEAEPARMTVSAGGRAVSYSPTTDEPTCP
jgi:hypothetical protein